MSENTATIFIIDDDNSVRSGLSRLLRSVGYQTETYSSAQEFLEYDISRERTGCIILDLKMPGITGLELQTKLTKFTDALPIIFITGHGDILASVKAMKAGAVDFLTKPFEQEDLLNAIAIALKKDEENKKQWEENSSIRTKLDLLTPREFEIMTYVISGLLNKQIGSELGITERTVKVHRGRVMEKMEVVSIAELVRATEKAGIKPALSSPN